MKKLFILATLVLLAACEPSEEQVAHANAVLPRGCSLTYVGNYGGITNLVVAVCEGRTTTTTIFREQHGKVSVENAAVYVSD
jgi:hypothetical protein